MTRTTSLALFLACVATAAFAEPPRSIVGYWQSAGQPCWPSAGATRIGAMSLAIGEEIYCEFDSVRRAGATVTWTGQCEVIEDRNQQDRSFPETVVATETNGRLNYRFRKNGLVMSGLRRCKP
jgi:hypothetical protein